MDGKVRYEFQAKVWKHDSPGGWYFVSMPKLVSKEIRENLQWQEEGWGRMKAIAKVEKLQWETAIWFDTKHNTYILPIKNEIRTKANVDVDKKIEVVIWV